MLWNHSLLASFLSRIVKAMLIQSPKATTYVRQACRPYKAHFKLNRAFRVIQGHRYWCRKESKTVYCHNVQLMPTLFLKLTKTCNGKTANSSISTTPLRLEDAPARNALNIYKWFILPETRVIDLHFFCWEYGSTFICCHIIMLEYRTLWI